MAEQQVVQRPDITRAHFSDNDDDFRCILGLVKERHPSLISTSTDLHDFSLWRSLRWGALLETTNQGVDPMVIELINQWRKKEAAKGLEAGLPMRQVYTQVQDTIPKMIQYSAAL